MQLPDLFNSAKDKPMEEVWNDFEKGYEIDIDSFRYGESKFDPKDFDKIVEYIGGDKPKKEIIISYLLGQLFLANKLNF